MLLYWCLIHNTFIHLAQSKQNQLTTIITSMPMRKSLVLCIPENTHLLREGKYHCTTDLLFDWFGFGQTSVLWIKHKQSSWILISGKSYKASTIVIYDSRVVPDLKIPHIMTLDS